MNAKKCVGSSFKLQENVSHAELLQKSKVHLLLHLVECMMEFGPTAAFNTERYISGTVTASLYKINANP